MEIINNKAENIILLLRNKHKPREQHTENTLHSLVYEICHKKHEIMSKNGYTKV